MTYMQTYRIGCFLKGMQRNFEALAVLSDNLAKEVDKAYENDANKARPNRNSGKQPKEKQGK